MTFIDPGEMFVKTFGKVETANDVFAYVDFLRSVSGLDGLIPVDLDLIFHRFQIPVNFEGETQVLSLIEYLG